MNYRLKSRVYWGEDSIFILDLGVFPIGDAVRMMRYVGDSDRDAWLEPTEEPVYRVWCRDYRPQFAGAYGTARVYSAFSFATDIGRATQEISRLRQTQRDGEVGSDYWLVREEG